MAGEVISAPAAQKGSPEGTPRSGDNGLEKGNIATRFKDATVAKAKSAAKFLRLRRDENPKKGLEEVVALDENSEQTKNPRFDGARTRMKQFWQNRGRNSRVRQAENKANLALETIDGPEPREPSSDDAEPSWNRAEKSRLRIRLEQRVDKSMKKHDLADDQSKTFAELNQNNGREQGKFTGPEAWKNSTTRMRRLIGMQKLTDVDRAYAASDEHTADVQRRFRKLNEGSNSKRERFRNMAQAIYDSRTAEGDKLTAKIGKVESSKRFDTALKEEIARRTAENGGKFGRRAEVRAKRELLVKAINGEQITNAEKAKAERQKQSPESPNAKPTESPAPADYRTPAETPEAKYKKRIDDIHEKHRKGEINDDEYTKLKAEAYNDSQAAKSGAEGSTEAEIAKSPSEALLENIGVDMTNSEVQKLLDAMKTNPDLVKVLTEQLKKAGEDETAIKDAKSAIWTVLTAIATALGIGLVGTVAAAGKVKASDVLGSN
jgi:hypothetical protein